MEIQNEKALKSAFWWILGLALFVFCFDLGNREPLAYDFRHGVILRQMLREGFSWIPTLLDVPYAQKPPFFFWVLYPFGKLFGSTHISVLVLPSALSAVGIVCLIFSLLRRLNLQWAILSSLILITTYPFFLKARLSTVDMHFAFWVTLILTSFFRYYIWRQKGMGVILLLSFIAAWFTKGPIGILLPASILSLYLMVRQKWKDFFIYGGLLALIFSVCFIAWYGMTYKYLGPEFVKLSLQSHTYGRVLEPANKPILFYVFVVLVMGLPWSFPLVGILKEKLKREKKENFSPEMMELEKFVFIWFSFIFLLFTLISVKHLRYLIPLFPPMAILASSFFVGKNEEDPWRRVFWKIIPWGIWSVVLAVLVAAALWFQFPETSKLQNPLMRYLVLGATLLCFFIWEIRRKIKANAFRWVSLMMGLLSLQVFNSQFVEPTISYAKSPKEIILKFEKINQRQNPLGFYQLDRNDLFRYIYYSWRFVHPMQIFEPEKIISTMKFMKYKRGHFVTYRKNYDALPDKVKKDCVIMQEEPFRNQTWVNAKWRDPAYP